MMYYKNTDSGYLLSLSTGYGQTEITEEEYNAILTVIRSAPPAPEGFVYLLRADTLDWELAEAPSEPEPEPEEEEIDDAEAFGILFGGAE